MWSGDISIILSWGIHCTSWNRPSFHLISALLTICLLLCTKIWGNVVFVTFNVFMWVCVCVFRLSPRSCCDQQDLPPPANHGEHGVAVPPVQECCERQRCLHHCPLPLGHLCHAPQQSWHGLAQLSLQYACQPCQLSPGWTVSPPCSCDNGGGFFLCMQKFWGRFNESFHACAFCEDQLMHANSTL